MPIVYCCTPGQRTPYFDHLSQGPQATVVEHSIHSLPEYNCHCTGFASIVKSPCKRIQMRSDAIESIRDRVGSPPIDCRSPSIDYRLPRSIIDRCERVDRMRFETRAASLSSQYTVAGVQLLHCLEQNTVSQYVLNTTYFQQSVLKMKIIS